MDTRPTVKKYEEMDRILAEREAIYERDVISRYEELSDEEFCELAYSHVKRCSYLVQRVKKVKSVIKNVIKEEITNAKDKVVATDDEHDENVDNVEMSKEPDMFDESEEESETDDNESAYESDDYVDSDESGESYDYEDNFQESYIHSDYEPKKLKNVKNESPSFNTISGFRIQ
uniref:Uncharacterized protein n=1 Tax=Panagrolaimus superbus TaxID=310955 RepID=A0A914YWW5_9BILA